MDCAFFGKKIGGESDGWHSSSAIDRVGTATDAEDQAMSTNRLIKHIGGGVEAEITLIDHPNHGVVILKTRKDTSQISNEANVALTLIQGDQSSRNTLCQVFSIEGPASDMIIEYCDGGDLRYVINQLHVQSYCLGKAFLRHVQLHLGAALVYLHCGIHFDVAVGDYKYPSLHGPPWNRISHRDIKPDNIFLRWTNKVDSSCLFPDIILGDFGNAITERNFDSVLRDHGRRIEAPMRRNFCGQNYGPPEFFLLEGGDDIENVSVLSSFDMWQFGATLYELVTRIVLNMVLQNQDRNPDKTRKWISKEDWGEISAEVINMIKENRTERVTDEMLVKILPIWKTRRNEEFDKEDGVGRRDVGWLRENTQRIDMLRMK
ncbi:hypothetical protein FKW77_006498 [Venturia effusa]|uniref:non-specific serine/threonine protein kinase n=1 Tax=Venturia effusa TaxID=50376 RepID=A0A517LP63_9PEZI|nr:hypothetical protein FKW77_006498 [Venturia effusa]